MDNSSQPQNLQVDIMKTSRSSYDKVKTVTGRLVDIWTKLINTESNIFLFSELIKHGISTNDVHSFLLSQAKLRKVNTNLDPPMSRSAMRAKLNDAAAYLVRLKQSLAKVKRDILKAVGNKCYMQRKIIRQVRFKIEDKRKILASRVNKKIKRYLDIQGKMKVDSLSFTLPELIKEFDDLSVFAENGFENVDPNLLDKNIVLSPAEIAVLSKGPKFAVRQEILEEDFKIDLEKMVFKHKYSSTFHCYV